ncbi:MAG TPA: chemotaxis protein CheA [Kofleriaceae bacterium]|nr:chemotaxis protein CheA [Kofleriaceae bacterium]
MAKSPDKVLGEFLSEAQEIVESLNGNLLAIDQQRASGRVDPDLVNACFRGVHSLKGLSGLVGLEQLTELSHALESLLDAIRLGKIATRPDVLDVLFESVELFGRGLTAAAAGGDLEAAQVDAFLARLEEAIAPPPPVGPEIEDDGFGGYELDPALLSVLTEYEEHRLRESIRAGAVIYRLHGAFDLMAIDRGIEDIKQRVKPVGEILTYLPGGSSEDPNVLELDILVSSHAGDRRVAELLEGSAVELTRVPQRPALAPPAIDPPPQVPVPTPMPPTDPPPVAPMPAAPMPAAPTPAASAPFERDAELGEADEIVGSLRSVSQSVRVDIRKLDALMTAVGELGLVHTGLASLLERLGERRLTEESQALRHEVRALERKLTELQNGILEVRMVPLRQIFDKLSRVVRKVSRSVGKQIRLEINGGETELDKLIVEELSDPLMHIIRNAIDHGLETAAERIAAGKSEVGTISVRAFPQGNRVLVSVSDDGRGIDEHAVAAAALQRGLIDAAQVGDMTRRELHNLLFLPGMSTRAEATEISGRGVGLDVVKTNIANLSGIIDVSSTPGLGTQVTITLPITLAIIQAIIANVAGRTYAIPLNSVVESLMIPRTEVRAIEGKPVISLRRQTLRLIYVDAAFALDRGGSSPDASPDAQLFVVVVGIAQHRVGLVVDELVGQQDIVIKSLGRALSSLRGIAGATELSGQRTVLVLDIPSLVDGEINRGVEAA